MNNAMQCRRKPEPKPAVQADLSQRQLGGRQPGQGQLQPAHTYRTGRKNPHHPGLRQAKESRVRSHPARDGSLERRGGILRGRMPARYTGKNPIARYRALSIRPSYNRPDSVISLAVSHIDRVMSRNSADSISIFDMSHGACFSVPSSSRYGIVNNQPC